MFGQSYVASGHAPVWQSNTLPSRIDTVFVARCHVRQDEIKPEIAQPTRRRIEIVDPLLRLAAAIAATLLIGAFAAALGVGLYVLKSTMGIDLFASHSFMHNFFYYR
ncbi:MAG: hypothetical protein AAFY64_07245 [Pseudomonadota bacterium]